jgi:hypothetical protein
MVVPSGVGVPSNPAVNASYPLVNIPVHHAISWPTMSSNHATPKSARGMLIDGLHA